MGTCKDSMTAKSPKAKKLFDRIRKKKDAKPTTEKKAESWADLLAELDEKLDSLVQVKEVEAKSEKGQEKKNLRSLSHLQTMRFHLDKVIDHAEEYGS